MQSQATTGRPSVPPAKRDHTQRPLLRGQHTKRDCPGQGTSCSEPYANQNHTNGYSWQAAHGTQTLEPPKLEQPKATSTNTRHRCYALCCLATAHSELTKGQRGEQSNVIPVKYDDPGDARNIRQDDGQGDKWVYGDVVQRRSSHQWGAANTKKGGPAELRG